MSRVVSAIVLVFLFFVSSRAAVGQIDPNTTLLLRMENALVGEQGEAPVTSTGHSFQPGIQGQGALLPNPNNLAYQANGNVQALEGTLEFWLKPTWNGNDNQDHFILRWGGGGGILIGKDGANNLKIILNRFGTFPGGERGVAVNISSWTANQWHHVAFTYSNTSKQVAVYTDGSPRSQSAFTGDLPLIPDTTFQIGGDGAGGYIQSVVDELRISNIARTPQEIAAQYIAALTVTSITATPNTVQMLPTWWKTPTLQAVTNLGTISVPATAPVWTTTNSAVAAFDFARGKVIANGPGVATLTANLNGAMTNITVNVDSPVLAPLVEAINPNLANPAANALWEMPVVIIDFIPTVDGVNVDPVETGATGSLVNMRNNLNRIQIQHKFMLEEGSRFRAYGSSAVQPSLGYRVVHKITIFEKMPEGILDPGGNGSYFPDYDQILTRVNAQNFVNNLGVKEFWIGMYHFGHISPVESNMASPTTGDISNSYRHNDLPIFDKTYVVYGINFTRTAAEATHNHGHQLEAIHRFTNQRQDGNTQLFMQRFCGFAANGSWQRGRAGDTHHPPNALTDYDYSNTTPFASDIADWRPLGGTTVPVSLSMWRNINYEFPDGILPPSDDAWWYIYWFQSMPGHGNSIPYNSNRMTNWWQFTGDWDAAYRAGIGLYESASCTYSISATSQNFSVSGGTGTVVVTAPSGCKWFASSNGNWTSLTSGDIGNGTGTLNYSVPLNSTGASRSTKIVVAGQPFTITQGTNTSLEGDVSPRPEGDGLALSTDVTQMRRFVSGLDSLNPATTEFQRADCGPRSTFGDGILTSSDVVQARRYVSGLDPATDAGGPAVSINRGLEESIFEWKALQTAYLRVAKRNNGASVVELESTADLAAVSFRLKYDAAKLGKPLVSLSDLPNGAVLTVNDTVDGELMILIDSAGPLGAVGESVRLVEISFANESADGSVALDGVVSVSDLFGNDVQVLVGRP